MPLKFVWLKLEATSSLVGIFNTGGAVVIHILKYLLLSTQGQYL